MRRRLFAIILSVLAYTSLVAGVRSWRAPLIANHGPIVVTDEPDTRLILFRYSYGVTDGHWFVGANTPLATQPSRPTDVSQDLAGLVRFWRQDANRGGAPDAGDVSAARYFRTTYFRAPFWFATVLLAAYPLLMLMRREAHRCVKRRKGRCIRCGVTLPFAPGGACPVCGVPFLRRGSTATRAVGIQGTWRMAVALLALAGVVLYALVPADVAGRLDDPVGLLHAKVPGVQLHLYRVADFVVLTSRTPFPIFPFGRSAGLEWRGTDWGAFVAIWLLVLIGWLLAMLPLLLGAWRTVRIVRRLRRDHCGFCNYPLNGLPNRRCPECGADWTHSAVPGTESDELEAPALSSRSRGPQTG